jgi:hypothetical protein
MTVRIEMRQTRELLEGPIYRVKNEVYYASGIEKEVFVFQVVDEEFDHVAYPYDMEETPVGKLAAATAGNNFYRASEVTRDYNTLVKALEFAIHSRGRVEYLADEYETATEGFEGEADYVYES